MARALLANTRKGSCVTAKMAGIESTAKMMSVTSTITSTASSGVAMRMPLRRVRKRWPSYSSVVGTNLRNSRSVRDLDTSMCSSRCRSILMPVRMRNAPKM